ncbi:MAG: serine/threonine-protein kinase [Myxococcota bacterium]
MAELTDRTRAEGTQATLVDTAGSGARAARADDPLDRGRSLGRYLIVDVLGAGAMGVVYRAYDPDLDRSLAVKLVGLDGDGTSRGEREQARLLREAQAMARVSHPNVIQVFDVGSLDNAVYVAMELVDGITLKEWLVGTRTPAQIMKVFDAAGRGLAAAHRQGLVHRDFKPDNVMVDRENTPRVLDFGLARASHRPVDDESVEELRSGERKTSSPSLETSMTQAGSIIGTPAYMSPEQHRGDEVSTQSDQFSFCVALFEALVGRRPFRGSTLAALSAAVSAGRIDAPTRSTVPRSVMKAIVRGLSVNPDDRFPSMDALLGALALRRKSTRGLGLLVGAAGLTIGGMAWAWAPAEPAAPQPCSGAADAVSDVWSEARRTSIATRFADEANALGTRIWTDTAQRFDTYASRWAGARTDACEATRVRGEQSDELLDRRIACYDRQLTQLDATLNALEAADRTAILNALDAAAALPALEMCADGPRLLEAVPAPTNPAVVAQVDALEARLAAAAAEYSLGHYEAVLEDVRAAATETDALDYPPVRGLAYRLLGNLQIEGGEDNPGAASYETALQSYLLAHDDIEAGRVALDLALIRGNVLADTDEGLRLLTLARTLLTRGGGSPRLHASSLSNEAAIYVTKGEMQQALDLYEQVREVHEADDPNGDRLASTLMDIGSVLAFVGKATDSIGMLERAVELRTATYGEDHPLTANALRELGKSLSVVERFDEAKVVLERALKIQETARGRTNRQVAIVLDDLGRILRAQNDLDAAAARHREAYAVWETLYDGPNPALVVSGMNIGYTLNAAGKFDEAFETFKDTLAMAETASGADHPHVVYAANAAASSLIDQKRFDEAYVYAKKALDLDGRAEVPPTLFAETRFLATHALWKDGNVPAATKDRARALARRAKEIYLEGPPQWAPYIETIDTWLAANG